MSDVPKSITLAREDFPEQAGWIDRLLRPLNGFISQVASGLARLSLEQNVTAQIQMVRVDTPGAVTDAFPVYFSTKFKPRLLLVSRAENLTTEGATFTTAVFPSWSPTNDGRVKVSHITGLSTNTKYRFTLLLFP